VLARIDERRLSRLPPGDAAGELEAAAETAERLVARFRFEYAVRERLRGIRATPELDRAP